MHKQILTSCHRGGTWIPSSGRKNEVPTIFSRPLEKLNYPYIRYNEKISQKPCKIVKRTQIKGYLKNTWGLYYQVSGFFYIFHLLQITPCSADLHIPPCPPLPPPPAALESLAHSLSCHIWHFWNSIDRLFNLLFTFHEVPYKQGKEFRTLKLQIKINSGVATSQYDPFASFSPNSNHPVCQLINILALLPDILQERQSLKLKLSNPESVTVK